MTPGAGIPIDLGATRERRRAGGHLVEHCRAYLTPVKLPQVVHVLDEIPRTPTGKLQRRRIATAIYGE